MQYSEQPGFSPPFSIVDMWKICITACKFNEITRELPSGGGGRLASVRNDDQLNFDPTDDTICRS